MKEIVDKIRNIRRNNNDLWMRLLEIALEHSPGEAKATLRKINFNDGEISKLLGKLTQ